MLSTTDSNKYHDQEDHSTASPHLDLTNHTGGANAIVKTSISFIKVSRTENHEGTINRISLAHYWFAAHTNPSKSNRCCDFHRWLFDSRVRWALTSYHVSSHIIIVISTISRIHKVRRVWASTATYNLPSMGAFQNFFPEELSSIDSM